VLRSEILFEEGSMQLVVK